MTSDADDKMLDGLFAAMRDGGDVFPTDALLDRIMLDADAVLAQTGPAAVRGKAQSGFAAMLLDIIGGWAAVSGLAAATVAGVWIGVAQPGIVADLSAGWIGGTIEVPLLESEIFAELER